MKNKKLIDWKAMFSLTSIFIIVVLGLMSIGLTLFVPHFWHYLHFQVDHIFTWKRLGWGLALWFFLASYSTIYLYLKRPKNKNYNLASSRFMNAKEFQKVIETYNWNDEHLNGFLIKTMLNKKFDKCKFGLAKKTSHALVIGSTDAGKTSLLIDPQIRILATAKNRPSMFITDPKGGLLRKHAGWLQKQGYEILSINLRKEKFSSYWNPLEKIWNMWKEETTSGKEKAQAELAELALALFPNEQVKGKDSFFESGANTVFQFFALACLELSDRYPEVTKNHFNINNILNNIQQTSDKEVRKIISMLPSNSVAMQMGGRNVRGDAKVTVQNLFQNVITSLQVYNDPIIKRVTCKTTLKINIEKPQVIFIVIPDETKAKYPFVSLFVEETYKELIKLAAKEENGQLPRPVYYLLEEFGNLPKITNMDAMISISRSRNIFFMLVIQNYEQLNLAYGKNAASNIIANAGIEYFILTNAYETAKKFSDKLGDASLITFSRSSSSNAQGSSSSKSASERTRKLIHPHELTELKFGEMIIKMQRHKPMKIKTSPFYKFQGFQIKKWDFTLHTKEFNYNEEHLKLLHKLVKIKQKNEN